MGKSHRRKLAAQTPKRTKPSKNSKPTGITKSKSSNKPALPSKTHKQVHQSTPTIPFAPHDSILLVGEGDLSFSVSLLTHHGCTNVTATVYESSEEELVEKYPHAAEHIKIIEEGEGKVRFGVDVTKGLKGAGKGEKRELWDRVIFNFPHVGGKTKDVNRQVRFNQGQYSYLTLQTRVGLEDEILTMCDRCRITGFFLPNHPTTSVANSRLFNSSHAL